MFNRKGDTSEYEDYLSTSILLNAYKHLSNYNHKMHNIYSLHIFTIFLLQNSKIKVYRSIILPVALYGCETWSLTLRKERRLRVFEKRVLMRIFGPKRHEVTGEWRKLCNEELNDLYSSPNIVQVIKLRMRWAGRVACMGERRGVYRVLVGKPEGTGPLVRPRHRWEDNIKVYLQEVGCGVWTGLSWLRKGTSGGHW